MVLYKSIICCPIYSKIQSTEYQQSLKEETNLEKRMKRELHDLKVSVAEKSRRIHSLEEVEFRLYISYF